MNIGLNLHMNNSQWVVGLYGKNLLDKVGHGINFVSRNPRNGVGGFSPLSKGRVYGLELTCHFTGV